MYSQPGKYGLSTCCFILPISFHHPFFNILTQYPSPGTFDSQTVYFNSYTGFSTISFFRIYNAKRRCPESLLITAQRLYMYVGFFNYNRLAKSLSKCLACHNRIIIRCFICKYTVTCKNSSISLACLFPSILRLPIHKIRRVRSSCLQVFLHSQRTLARIRCLPVLLLP